MIGPGRLPISRVNAAFPQGYQTGRLTPGLITRRIPEPVLTGLSSEALAVMLKLLMKSTLEAR